MPLSVLIPAGCLIVAAAAIDTPSSPLAQVRLSLQERSADNRRPMPGLAAGRPCGDPSGAGPATMPQSHLQTPAPQRVIRMRVTAYCPCRKCCGRWADGFTASGEPVAADGGRFVAADPAVLPIGTRLIVPGYAAGPVRVLDTGGAIKGSRLDVFFPTHAEALQWGVRYLDVQVCR